MDYFDPNGECISTFDVCHAYQMLEANYNEGGWLRERPSNQRRMESIGCQLMRIGYSDLYRNVDLWLDDEEAEAEREICSDDDNVRYVYFKKVLEWDLPIEDDDRAVIDRLFTIDAIEKWKPDYFPWKPWRTALRPDFDDFNGPAWIIVRPRKEQDREIHLNSEGTTAYFQSYEAATQKAKSLTEELNASSQGAGAQGAHHRPGA